MKIIKTIHKHGGIRGSIKFGVQKIAGLEKIQEEIDTLRFFMEEYVDITQFPKTKDADLRLLQDGLLILLKIFDKLCKKYNLSYWLSSGTALGAERHHGFIPWDDDLDVCMPREDYDKVIPLLKDELEPYGILVRWGGYFDKWGYLARLALAYKTLETGIWMDIFPAEKTSISIPISDARPILDKAIDQYRQYYLKVQNRIDDQIIKKQRSEIFSSYGIGEGEHIIYIEAPEFGDGHRYMLEDDVFPIKRVSFEDTMIPVYNNNPAYLVQCYGQHYMSFPKRGIGNHLDPDGMPAKTRAKRHNIDMNEVISHLEDVYHQI